MNVRSVKLTADMANIKKLTPMDNNTNRLVCLAFASFRKDSVIMACENGELYVRYCGIYINEHGIVPRPNCNIHELVRHNPMPDILDSIGPNYSKRVLEIYENIKALLNVRLNEMVKIKCAGLEFDDYDITIDTYKLARFNDCECIMVAKVVDPGDVSASSILHERLVGRDVIVRPLLDITKEVNILSAGYEIRLMLFKKFVAITDIDDAGTRQSVIDYIRKLVTELHNEEYNNLDLYNDNISCYLFSDNLAKFITLPRLKQGRNPISESNDIALINSLERMYVADRQF